MSRARDSSRHREKPLKNREPSHFRGTDCNHVGTFALLLTDPSTSFCMPWLFNTLHFQQKLAECLHIDDSFRLAARRYAMNNPEKSPTSCVDVECQRRAQSTGSVFLIFWIQNLVKGLPLRRLLKPSGPIWSYLRGVTEIVSIGVGGPTGCVRVPIMFRRPSVVAGATTNNAGAATFKMPTTADTAHCINNQKSPWPSPLASMGSDHRPSRKPSYDDHTAPMAPQPTTTIQDPSETCLELPKRVANNLLTLGFS